MLIPGASLLTRASQNGDRLFLKLPCFRVSVTSRESKYSIESRGRADWNAAHTGPEEAGNFSCVLATQGKLALRNLVCKGNVWGM